MIKSSVADLRDGGGLPVHCSILRAHKKQNFAVHFTSVIHSIQTVTQICCHKSGGLILVTAYLKVKVNEALLI